MSHYVGLDVSLKEVSICVVDAGGEVLNRASVPTEPDIIAEYVARHLIRDDDIRKRFFRTGQPVIKGALCGHIPRRSKLFADSCVKRLSACIPALGANVVKPVGQHLLRGFHWAISLPLMSRLLQEQAKLKLARFIARRAHLLLRSRCKLPAQSRR